MWVTIYFKTGKIIETTICSFCELDRYDKKEIDRIEMGTTIFNHSTIRQ